MKSTAQRRIARLAGLLLLALLVSATGIQAAQAAVVAGSAAAGSGMINTAQLPTLTQIQQHQGIGPYAPGVAAAQSMTPRAGTQGRGGVDLAPFTPASGAQPASSGTSSTTAWIAVGSAAALLAVLIVGLAAWVLVRRRRQPGESTLATYCARYPEAPVCTAA